MTFILGIIGFNIKTFRKTLKNIKVIHIPQNLRVLIFGGALNTGCYRDKLLSDLKTESEYLTVVPDKINYFDISSEQYDLMDKETHLFENSDTLIIIPESAGSFAELGMIAAMISSKHRKKHEQTEYAKKILIILNEKYKHDESFLRLGPIKIIKNLGGNIININIENDKFSKIEKLFDPYKKNKKKSFKNTDKNKSDLFFINSIKILIYIYILL